MSLLLQASTVSPFNPRDLLLIAPALILVASACAVLVMEVVLPYRRAAWTNYFAQAALGLSLVSLLVQWRSDAGLLPLSGFYGMIRVDHFALFLQWVFVSGAMLTIAISRRYLDAEREQRGEFYALVLFATTGMMLLACSYDLIALYISLELMAVTFYVLVAYAKRDRRSNEAAIKYFLLGAFSSGVLLYGMSLLFGVAGSTNLADIAPALAASLGSVPAAEINGVAATNFFRPLVLLGVATLAAGMFFKISAVPFHMWAPDAYEGAPTPITAFLSTGSKAASFALLTRLFADALADFRADWAPLVGLVAAVTILVGNWAAVTQTSAKRLLAYSSISNAGYLLLGLIAGNNYGYTGLAFYLFVYTLMNVGAFGVIIKLRNDNRGGDEVDDFNGLGRREPATALAMTVFLLSLGGLPATGGFIGKYFLFGGLLQRGAAEGRNWHYALALWALLNTVVSFYYYARFIRAMYLSDSARELSPVAPGDSAALRFALAAAAVVVVAAGVYPQPLIRLAASVVASFGGG